MPFGNHHRRLLGRLPASQGGDRKIVEHLSFWSLSFRPPARRLKWRRDYKQSVPTFEELLAQLLEEPEEVLGILSDIVNRGRMQADDLPQQSLEILTSYDLVVYLIQRSHRSPVRTWVYPSPLGLRTFAFLEREAEREREMEQAQKTRRKSSRRSGAQR